MSNGVVLNLEEEIMVKSLSDFYPHHKGLPNIPHGSGIKRGDVLVWVKNKENLFIVKRKRKKKR